MLRQTLLQMSKSDRVRSIVQKAPLTRSVVTRFIAGSTTDDGVRASSDIVHSGRLVTLDNLGEDTLDVHQARATRDEYLRLLAGLEEAGLTDGNRGINRNHAADQPEWPVPPAARSPRFLPLSIRAGAAIT